MATRAKRGAKGGTAVGDPPAQNKSYAASSTIERGTALQLIGEIAGKPGEKREPCICGCGQTPSSATALFMPGHDSRVRHMGKKVLDGDLKKSEIPAPALKYLNEGGFFEGRKVQ